MKMLIEPFWNERSRNKDATVIVVFFKGLIYTFAHNFLVDRILGVHIYEGETAN